jgi:AraC-like DNA-binding protein
MTVSARHLTEWSVGFFTWFLREHFLPEWDPVRISFEHSGPTGEAALSELHRRLGPRIDFDQEASFIEVDMKTLRAGRPGIDPGLLELLLATAEDELATIVEQDSLTALVRMHIAEQMKRRVQDADAIASTLAMSPSTLRRRLKDEGTSVRELRDDVLRELATQALRQTRANISSISYELGYSEVSAFDRAFRRVTGQSPTEYRNAAGSTSVGS